MELKNLALYKEKLGKGSPEVKLVRPCRLDDGILSLERDEVNQLLVHAKRTKSSIGYFVPASGSGSRMFSFIYQYLSDPSEENLMNVEHFFGKVEFLAIFQLLPSAMRKQILAGEFDMNEVLTYILTDEGLDIGSLPKALIPFHSVNPFVLNALQEQIIQAQDVHRNIHHIHFTIQDKFLTTIHDSVELLRKMSGFDVEVEFSYQDPETDVVALDQEMDPVMDGNGEVIKRPAGHGALLHNLNRMMEEIVLVKNIDNIQHWENRESSKKWWNVLIGLLETVKNDLALIARKRDRKAFASFNAKYQLFDDQWTQMNDEELFQKMKRPIRVCGMVRNIGQPGGGPYWIEDENGITKQIIEKSQISSNEEQRHKMIRSTHFNPVMLALSTTDFEGNKHDLLSFVDDNKYFVVEKTQEGKQIKYIELPGLWNGSMAHWNTIFVEVPSSTFSPVKSVLDLLDPLHQPKHE